MKHGLVKSSENLSKDHRPRTTAVVYTIEEMKAEVDSNYKRISNFGMYFLVSGFVFFILWATLAPLDKGTPAGGELVIEGNRQVVQHLSSGTVDKVLVRNGDKVEKGQALIKLNQVSANASLQIAKTQYINSLIQELRLRAERNLSDSIDVSAVPFSENEIKEAYELQSSLLRTQLDSFKSQISILEENLQSTEAQLASLQKIRSLNQVQLGAVNRQLKGITQLAKEGYVSRNSQIDLSRTAAQIASTISENESSIAKASSSIASIKLQILSAKQDFQKNVESQLADAIKQSSNSKNQYDAAKYDAENTVIVAPVAGIVTNLNVNSGGSVIGGGQTLLEIVPDVHNLVLKVHVPNESINDVHVGLKVRITFNAFVTKNIQDVEGIVTLVAADSTIDPKAGVSFYNAEVKITDEGYRHLGENKLIPGMQASVIIVKGERTLFNYLFEPLLRHIRLSTST